MFQSYTEHKLPVFPLIKRTKKPTSSAKGWTSFDWFDNDRFKDEIEENRAFGVALTDEWIVIDIDRYKDGAEQSAEMLVALGLSFETFTVQSARGGLHLYYKNPSKQVIAKTLPNYPGIDFLSKGCYCVGPGTITSDGIYEIVSGELSSALTIPDSILNILEKRQASISDDESAFDLEIERDRFIEYLSLHPGATEGESGDQETFKVAARGRDYGLGATDVYTLMVQHWNQKCSPPWTHEDLRIKVAHAYKYSKNSAGVGSVNIALFEEHDVDTERSIVAGWDIDTKGKLKPTIHNLMCILQLPEIQGAKGSFYELFQYNEFEKCVEMSRKPFWRLFNDNADLSLGNMDILRVRDFISSHFRIDFGVGGIREAIYSTSYVRSFHPIRDYLSSLVWDGRPRLKRLFNEYFGTGDRDSREIHYRAMAGTAFILASVYRIFEPGYKFDSMLVLSGRPNVGKSLFVEVMAGKKYCLPDGKVSLDPKEVHKMAGKWWIEYPEASAATKADVDEIKAFITVTQDTYRKPYDPLPETHKRQCVLVWTLNPTGEGFLRDETGNRRFLIIDCDRMIQLDRLQKDRDQLYAEAVHMFRQGIEPLDLLNDKIVVEVAREKQDANMRDMTDPWTEKIQVWLNETQPEYDVFNDCRTVTIGQILEGLGFFMARDQDLKVKTRVARAMRQLGWQNRRSNGKTLYFNPEDIYNPWDI